MDVHENDPWCGKFAREVGEILCFDQAEISQFVGSWRYVSADDTHTLVQRLVRQASAHPAETNYAKFELHAGRLPNLGRIRYEPRRL